MSETAQEAPRSIEERISAIVNEPPPEVSEQAPSVPMEAHDEAPAEVAEAPEAPIEAVEESEPEVNEIEVKDLTDFIEKNGYDSETFWQLPVAFSKNGERAEFTLSEIKDRYQDLAEAESFRAQAEAAAKAAQQRQAEIDQYFQNHEAQVARTLQGVQNAMMAEMQAINWQELEVKNPGEWARLQTHYRNKSAELQRIWQQTQQELGQQRAEHQKRVDAEQQERLQRESQLLLRAIPEWREEKTANAERSALVEYMRDRGFTSDEINAVSDHRALVLARKAMLYDQLKTKGDVASKRVVKIASKTLKPGERVTTREAQQDKVRAAITEHRKNPKSLDAAAQRIRLKIGK